MLSANEQPFKTSTKWKLKKTVMFCARHFFCSQVFKTTSIVLNSDVNIVNIALIAFLLAGGYKVGSLADVEFKEAKYEIPES